MKLRQAEALIDGNGSRAEEATSRQSKARRVEQRAGNVEKERDLPDDGYTHSGWMWGLLDQMLLRPLCCCLPIFNRCADPQSLSGNARTSVPSKDATQNPASLESGDISKPMSSLQTKSVQRNPPVKPGPQPRHH